MCTGFFFAVLQNKPCSFHENTQKLSKLRVVTAEVEAFFSDAKNFHKTDWLYIWVALNMAKKQKLQHLVSFTLSEVDKFESEKNCTHDFACKLYMRNFISPQKIEWFSGWSQRFVTYEQRYQIKKIIDASI